VDTTKNGCHAFPLFICIDSIGIHPRREKAPYRSK